MLIATRMVGDRNVGVIWQANLRGRDEELVATPYCEHPPPCGLARNNLTRSDLASVIAVTATNEEYRGKVAKVARNAKIEILLVATGSLARHEHRRFTMLSWSSIVSLRILQTLYPVPCQMTCCATVVKRIGRSHAWA